MDLEIEGFTPMEIVGRGGSATVYRAREDAFDREVALKVFDIEFGDADQQRFVRELRAIGRLGEEHHAVALVFAAGTTRRNKPFISMRYYPGGSLQAAVKRNGPVRLSDALVVADCIGGALDVAHAAGVLHRDVKPANVLLDGKQLAVLADFGIASFVEGAAESSVTMSMMTPAYAPLERLNGEPATTASDVYSLAATLWSILAGHVPHAQTTGDSVGTIMHRIVQGDIKPLGRQDLPPQVEQVLRRGLETDPAMRPSTPGALVAALHEAGDHTVITSVPSWGSSPPAPTASAAPIAGADDEMTRVKSAIEPEAAAPIVDAVSDRADLPLPANPVEEMTVARGTRESSPSLDHVRTDEPASSRRRWAVGAAAACLVPLAVVGSLQLMRDERAPTDVRVMGTVETTSTSTPPATDPTIAAPPEGSGVTETIPPAPTLPPEGTTAPGPGPTTRLPGTPPGRPTAGGGVVLPTSPPATNPPPTAGSGPPAPTVVQPPIPVIESLTCRKGGGVVDFSPALGFSNGTHSFRFRDALSGFDTCTDSTSRKITSGQLRGFVLTYGPVNCFVNSGSGSGIGTIAWSNGSTSQAELRLQLAPRELFGAPVGSVSLSVQTGPFAGRSFTAPATLDFGDRGPDCSTTIGTLTFGELTPNL